MKRTCNKVLNLTIVSIITLNLLMLLACSDKSEGNKHNENELEHKKSTLDNYTDLEIINKVLQNLELEDAYYVETSGETNAKCIVNYTQSTNTSLYYCDNKFYNDIASNSSLVNHSHKLLLNGNSVSYYDSAKKDDGLIKESADEYLNTYGILPSHQGIFHYIVKEDYIIDSSRSFTEKGFKVTYHFKPDESTSEIRKQMMIFGGLVEEPKYEKIELIIEIDENCKLIAFTNKESYKIVKKIPIFGKTTMNCTQTLYSKVHYSDYSQPDLSTFK